MCCIQRVGRRRVCEGEGVFGGMWGTGREDYDIKRIKYNNKRKSTYMRYINGDTCEGDDSKN